MARYRDFDQFFAKKRNDPIVLKYQGEQHALAPTIPVATVLLLKRMEAEKGEVSDDDVIALFKTVFTTARYTKWVANGMDLDQMIELLRWAMEQYGVAAPQVEQAQEGDENPLGKTTPESV